MCSAREQRAQQAWLDCTLKGNQAQRVELDRLETRALGLGVAGFPTEFEGMRAAIIAVPLSGGDIAHHLIFETQEVIPLDSSEQQRLDSNHVRSFVRSLQAAGVL
jgi:hypothetical protein